MNPAQENNRSFASQGLQRILTTLKISVIPFVLIILVMVKEEFIPAFHDGRYMHIVNLSSGLAACIAGASLFIWSGIYALPALLKVDISQGFSSRLRGVVPIFFRLLLFWSAGMGCFAMAGWLFG